MGVMRRGRNSLERVRHPKVDKRPTAALGTRTPAGIEGHARALGNPGHRA
jgi:hypothetical protein